MALFLRGIYANIQSVSAKKLLLQNFIQNNNINCVLLVETKATAENHSSSLSYRDWEKIERIGTKMGHNTRGGSLVKADRILKMQKQNRLALNNPSNECLHFAVPFGNDQLHMFLVYTHPVCMIENSSLIKASTCKYAIIIGDFNINHRKERQMRNFQQNSYFMEFPTSATFLRRDIIGTRPDRLYYTANLHPYLSNIKLTTDLCSDHLSIQF